MEAAFRAAWLIFGPVVASWTVAQLRAWAGRELGMGAADFGQAGHYNEQCGPAMRRALNADPDDGCYYWEYPNEEQ